MIGKKTKWIPALLAVMAISWGPLAQDAQETPRQRALQAIDRAIRTLGGEAYLNIRVLYNHGNWFAFDRDGRRSRLVKFWEWIQYEPFKWYFQKGSGGRQYVEVYNLELGQAWVKEGKGHVEELAAERIESFKAAVKHDLDYILRFRVREENIDLFYFGPDEIEGGEGETVAVQVLDETNDSVVIYFDREDATPIRLEYQEADKNGLRRRYSTEYFNWHRFNGALIPMRFDYFQDGELYEQRHMTDVGVNPPPEPGQFLKPPIKEQKKKKKEKVDGG